MFCVEKFSVKIKQNNLMPNGDANKTGASLEILHADRRNMGHYQCTADNRVGQPDTRGVFVNVQCKYYLSFKTIYNIIYINVCVHPPFTIHLPAYSIQ